jgi:hypothetical protein
MYLLVGGPRRKSGHFFNNISQTKTSVGGLNNAFFHHLRQQKGAGVKKGVKRRTCISGNGLTENDENT